jgi:hypothetical protein
VLALGSLPRPGSSALPAQISRAGSDDVLRPCPLGSSQEGSTTSPAGTLLFPGYAAGRLRRSRGEGEREWGGAGSERWLGCSVPRDVHAGASLHFAAGVATPAGAATVRPTSAKCRCSIGCNILWRPSKTALRFLI